MLLLIPKDVLGLIIQLIPFGKRNWLFCLQSCKYIYSFARPILFRIYSECTQIYLIGGKGKEQTLCNFLQFNVNFKSWRTLPDIPTRGRSRVPIVKKDHYIYAVGGYLDAMNWGAQSDELLRFDTKKFEWKKMARMNNRNIETAVLVNNRIYGFGYRATESYDFNRNIWEIVDIPYLSYRTCLVVHSTIFLAQDGFCIDPAVDNQWRRWTQLPLHRYWPMPFAAIHDFIYAMDEKSMYKIDTRISDAQWEFLCELPEKRTFMSSVNVDDKIYSFGGKGEDGTLVDTVWEYDIKGNKWSTLNTKIPIGPICNAGIISI